jgi:hypothetical protein
MRATSSPAFRLAVWTALLVPPILGVVLSMGDAGAAVSRQTSAQSAVLILGGAPAGNLRSVQGGSAVASVVEESAGPGVAPKKHIGAIRYEPMTLELELGTERPLFDWIAASWAGKAQPKSGSLLSVDINQNVRSSREFQNASLTQTVFPACDASSKDVGVIRVELTAERVTAGAAAGKPVTPAGRSRAWLSQNFRLEIDGLETNHVSRIEPITVQSGSADSGKSREPARDAGKLGFSNLQITLAESFSESWRKWHEDFVIQGAASDKHEKSGRLVLLGANLKDELAEIRFSSLGIVALRSRLGAGGLPVVTAELYAERMDLALDPSTK